MAPWLGPRFGNTSGSHAISRRAKNALEEARDKVAAVLAAKPSEIVFTAGGTEADNLALVGRAALAGGVVTTAVEHEAVLQTADFLERLGRKVTVVPVDSDGLIEPDRLSDAVSPETAVVSVMSVNNETGAKQPIEPIARILAERGITFHTDAVQAFCSQRVGSEQADLISLSAHKFGGPQGVGLLFVKTGTRLDPLVHGGGQEMGRRSGTHNLAGIVGMAAALEAADADRDRFIATTNESRQRFEAKLSDRAERTIAIDRAAPHISHLRFDTEADTMLVRLDRLGLSASAGSACQSGATTISHVLSAMAVEPHLARRALRFSFGWTTTPEEGDRAAELVLAALEEGR
jgi:cysteine desulfurase